MIIFVQPLIGMVGLWRIAQHSQHITDGPLDTMKNSLSRKLGLKRRVTLLLSTPGNSLTMPMSWGIVHPVVRLPSDAENWSVEKKHIVLLHELSHVQRWDCLTQVLAQIACAIYWFNPMTWLVASQLHIERERACDNQILTAGFKASDYADHLLEIARTLRSKNSALLPAVPMARNFVTRRKSEGKARREGLPFSPAFGFSRLSSLERRLRRILDGNQNRQPITSRGIIFGFLLSACILLPLGTIQLTGCREGKPKGFTQTYPEGLPKEIINDKDGSKMILIPAGEFIMGSPEGEGGDDEHPQHTVFLDAFYIDAYEVTNAQFKKFLEANPQWRKDKIEREYHNGDYLKDWDDMNYPGGKADHPVVHVSWYAAAAYAQWVGARLPTEAQWEKAARGGLVGKTYPWGDKLSHDDANDSGTGGRDQWSGTAPVGSFPANGYKLFDMAGNVWEWCADAYDDYYKNSLKNNPAGPETMVTFEGNSFTNVKTRRVVRGGSWFYNSLGNMRCADRRSYRPASMYDAVGFRCCVPSED